MNTKTMLPLKVVDIISKVPGVKAVVLGGSQSRKEAGAYSDFDIGLYYKENTLDVAVLEQALKQLDDGHRDNLLNQPGEWGPWINGGAWLTVENVPVDILLRDIKKVENVIKDCLDGKITIDYQCGHPYGFVNSIYAAETHYGIPLWQEKSAPLNQLKALLYSQGEYSPRMRDALIKKFLWEAWFSLSCGRKPAFKGDFNYAIGSTFRTVCSWVEVLYALNCSYLMNEKGALTRLAYLNHKPVDMETRIKLVYKLFAEGDVEKAYQMLDNIHSEIEALSSEIPSIISPIR